MYGSIRTVDVENVESGKPASRRKGFLRKIYNDLDNPESLNNELRRRDMLIRFYFPTSVK